MSCERYREELTDLAAGAPAPAGVEGHMASCEACRSELAALREALAEADAEMAGLLASGPSPQLPARIRQAVAGSEAPPAWRFGWLWPATAVAATLLVALAVWVGRAPSPQSRVAMDESRPRPAASAPARPSAGGPVILKTLDRMAADTAAAAAKGPPALPPRAPTVPSEPEVLVPPGESEALLRLVALVHRNHLSPASLAATGTPSADLAELAPLDIPALEIVPLDPAETSGT